MDHATANLISFPADPTTGQTIHCSFTHQAKETALQRGENEMHTKEQGEQAAYYQELANIIRNYGEVLLFGPTEAKTELYYTFKDNHLFADIKIDILPSDKLTSNQQHAFVKDFFENNESLKSV